MRKNKDIHELSDADWSELALIFNITIQQVLTKTKKLMKEEEKREQCEPEKLDSKISRRQMITKALADLPDQRGTKKEIFTRIERIYDINLAKTQSTYKTLEQFLSKYFSKTPQEYQLNPSADFSRFSVGANPGMKQMLISCMLKMRDRKGDIKQIKIMMIQLFGDKIRSEFVDRAGANCNLQEWEKTMLKTFSRYKDIFCKTKAVFSLQSSESNYSQRVEATTVAVNQDETMNYEVAAAAGMQGMNRE